MRWWPFRSEQKSLTSPTAEEFAIFGATSPTGYRASAADAMTVPAVQRAVALIPASIAVLGIVVEKRTGAA